MNKLEAVILFSPDLSIPLIKKEEDNFTKNIEGSDGKIITIEDWGLRGLSYSIKKFNKAFYKFYQIEIPGDKIVNIKKILNQQEKILRYLFVSVEDHQQLPTKMINNEEK